MTDFIERDDNSDEEDPRAQLQETLADGIATLSEAADMPSGVSPVSAIFSSNDFDFSSNTWMERLAQVQGWLCLSEDLPPTGGEPFLQAVIDEFNLESIDLLASGNPHPRLSVRALERLRERVDTALKLQRDFFEELQAKGASRATASQSWSDAWAEVDAHETSVNPDPVTAKAAVWPIYQLTKNPPNLTPSYQRGDVWGTSDRQALMESILRGVPLPSIILLRTEPSEPYEVVDGKQRLTTILRFVGEHPVAVRRVKKAAAELGQPRFDDRGRPDSSGEMTLIDLFKDDYPAFRRAWKALMREKLTASLENDYYFPFKLRATGDGGLVGARLEPLRGKYYTQIKYEEISVAAQKLTVKSLFEDVVEYSVPVIEYTRATQAQIHEVFRLYNKQGVHLNAEEIRNAVYHKVELTRATLAAAGDADPETDVADIAESLASVANLDSIGVALRNYGFGETRYKRTKVLSWVISVLVHDTMGRDLVSTSRNIDQLLDSIRRRPTHPLAQPAKLTRLFELLRDAVELHASHKELWSEQFMDGGKGAKWQELQLVGTLVGMAMAVAAVPDDIENLIEQNADAIRSASEGSEDWQRPPKTQTKTQWDYIARINKNLLELLEIEPEKAAKAVQQQFGSSGYASLQRMLMNSES